MKTELLEDLKRTINMIDFKLEAEKRSYAIETAELDDGFVQIHDKIARASIKKLAVQSLRMKRLFNHVHSMGERNKLFKS